MVFLFCFFFQYLQTLTLRQIFIFVLNVLLLQLVKHQSIMLSDVGPRNSPSMLRLAALTMLLIRQCMQTCEKWIKNSTGRTRTFISKRSLLCRVCTIWAISRLDFSNKCDCQKTNTILKRFSNAFKERLIKILYCVVNNCFLTYTA